MNRSFFQWFRHRLLRRPFILAARINQNPKGAATVVCLHGLGSSGVTWERVAAGLADGPYHVLSFDLLGFGESPKPLWLNYDMDDHARAVIATILKYRRRKRRVIMVGHSMGGLIAVRVARLRPDLVRHLILYQPPLYVGLPERRAYAAMRKFYFGLYDRLLRDPEVATRPGPMRAILRRSGIVIAPETLAPLALSLRNTIMAQTTLADMRALRAPMDVIYGSLDVVVIRGNPEAVFAGVGAPLETHNILGMHMVTARASRFIAERIIAMDKPSTML